MTIREKRILPFNTRNGVRLAILYGASGGLAPSRVPYPKTPMEDVRQTEELLNAAGGCTLNTPLQLLATPPVRTLARIQKITLIHK